MSDSLFVLYLLLFFAAFSDCISMLYLIVVSSMIVSNFDVQSNFRTFLDFEVL